MKQAWKEKWIEALRSNRYNQARGRLKTPNGMCCLGVLGDLAVKEKIATWKEQSYPFGGFLIKPVNGRKGSDVLLPATWAYETFGLTVRRQDILAHLNDKDWLSFKQIAEIIERKL